jgi:hypothetical protein
VNILDENILESQRQLLVDGRIPIRQIGHDIGHKGLKDKEIITFLLQLRRVTFFSLDSDFYKRPLCHAKYGLIHLDVRKHEVAVFVRRLLKHPEFDTVAKRMRKVARVSSAGLTVWVLHTEKETFFEW